MKIKFRFLQSGLIGNDEASGVKMASKPRVFARKECCNGSIRLSYMLQNKNCHENQVKIPLFVYSP